MFKDGRFQRVDLWKPSKLKEGKTHSTVNATQSYVAWDVQVATKTFITLVPSYRVHVCVHTLGEGWLIEDERIDFWEPSEGELIKDVVLHSL